ncbi:MAG: hypothetical protein Q6351_005625 [Candidatus Njordarchaeum guaymaensis]
MPKNAQRGIKLDDPRKIFIFTVFTALAGFAPLDYYETDTNITFLIRPVEARKIIDSIVNITRNLSSQLNKTVDLVFFSENMEVFIKNLFRPATVENIIRRKTNKGTIVLYIKVPPWDRGKALGRQSFKLYRARHFLSKYFDIEWVKII